MFVYMYIFVRSAVKILLWLPTTILHAVVGKAGMGCCVWARASRHRVSRLVRDTLQRGWLKGSKGTKCSHTGVMGGGVPQ